MAAAAALAVSTAMFAVGIFPGVAMAEQPDQLAANQSLESQSSVWTTTQSEALDPSNLADGEYQVSVSLTQTTSIDDQTMPTVFLKDTALIKVVDATPWLVATLQPAYVMGGGPYYADGLYFYAEGTFSVSGKVMTVSGGQTTSHVVSYMTDPADRFHHYPQDILGELPKSTTTNGGYMAVAMGSSQMSSSAVVLKIDWSSLSQVSAEKPQLPQELLADKTALDEVIQFAEGILQDQELATAYEQRAAGLSQELQSARDMYADEAATQSQVDAMAKALHGTALSYQSVDLKTVYDQASALDPLEYTAKTRADLATQLANAKTVLADEAATREQVVAACDALQAAVDALEKATVNKKSLASALEEAQSYKLEDQDGTLVASQKATDALRTAIQTAADAIANDEATQSQVNDVTKTLQTALNSWAKSVLEEALTKAKSMEQGTKTDEAFKALQSAIKSADTAFNRKNATRTDHLNAADKLNAAVAAFNASADKTSGQDEKPADNPGGNTDPAETGTSQAGDAQAADGRETPAAEQVDNGGQQAQNAVQSGKTYAVGAGANAATYKVLATAKKNAQGTVMLKKSRAPASAKKITVPATVKIKGVTYKVARIGANAFAGHKKLTQVTVGKNVKLIHAKAFGKAPKLRNITVKSKQLTTKKSVKNCLKGTKVKTVKVQVKPKAAKAKVKKAFSKYAGKRVAIK